MRKSFPASRKWRDILLNPAGGNDVPVLRGISFTVRPAEIFALLGPNGAGKTTLLKILSTLVIPDEGRVTIAGRDLVQDPAAVRGLVAPVLADERSLSWRLSARENLRFFAALYNLRGDALQKRVDELLEVVELTDTGNKMVGQFSSGMKQRLLIARALLSRPSVLLLDEPTRSLDPVSAGRFRAFLREEVAVRQGCTILLATHSPEEALDLSDSVGVMNRGRMVALGTADELSHAYWEERYRVWTRTPGHTAIAAMAAQGIITRLTQHPVNGEWGTIEFSVPSGAEQAADVLAHLVMNGVRVLRFERVRGTLAELIEAAVTPQP